MSLDYLSKEVIYLQAFAYKKKAFFTILHASYPSVLRTEKKVGKAISNLLFGRADQRDLSS